MTVYADAIVAQLTGPTVRIAALVHFDFRTQPLRLWTGTGELAALGEIWHGTDGLGEIGGIAQSADELAAEEVTFSLASTEGGLLANFQADAAEAEGRAVTLHEAFFGDDGSLITTRQVFAGTLGPLEAKRHPREADGAVMRVIEVRAVNLFANRNRPALRYFSDADQRTRSSDDELFARVAEYAGGTEIRWPVY